MSKCPKCKMKLVKNYIHACGESSVYPSGNHHVYCAETYKQSKEHKKYNWICICHVLTKHDGFKGDK